MTRALSQRRPQWLLTAQPGPDATGRWLGGSLATSPATVIKSVFDQAEARDPCHARVTEAEREGWLAEVEGLKVSLAGAGEKLAQIDRRSRTFVDLGIPGMRGK